MNIENVTISVIIPVYNAATTLHHCLESLDRQTYRKLELLFIDDVGTEPESVKSWGNEFSPVTELIYARYDRQLFTIATSNLADEEFGERYGLRIADRMEEMFERLHYKQNSYRR